jgi:uncharacterized membrane protein YbhN (UPF0104 family)
MKTLTTLYKNKVILWLLGILGLAGSIYGLMHFGQWHYFSRPPVGLLTVILAFTLLEMLCRAERLRRAARLLGYPISLRQSFWVNGIGDLFGAITPASIGGEVTRFAALLKLRMSPAVGVKTIAVERFSLLIALIFVIVISGLALVGLPRESYDFPSLRHTLFFYLGIFLVMVALLSGWVRLKKVVIDWRKYVCKKDLIGLGAVHHLIRISLLPLIVFLLTQKPPQALVFIWSFVLSYGVSLIPIPSGGGAVELAFMAALGPVLGKGTAGESLILWRLVGHYFYAVLGALIALAHSLTFARPQNRKTRTHPLFFNLKQGIVYPITLACIVFIGIQNRWWRISCEK